MSGAPIKGRVTRGVALVASLLAALWYAGPADAAVTDARVSVGTPSGSTPQNHQNEPAVAIDAHNPDVVVAGAIDQGDQQPCPQVLAVEQATCTTDNGVGVSGVYFSFDRGLHWVQPTYTGLTARDCASDSPCRPHVGPIGRVPWYYESGLVDAGDAAVAIGPKAVNGRFSWANGSRVYYSNLAPSLSDSAPDLADQAAIKGFMSIAVSRLDDPTPASVVRKSSWKPPVVVSKQNQAVFSDKDQVWADNASSSPYFGRVYDCYSQFRGNGQHAGTNNVPLPMMVSTSADGGDTWTQHQLSAADGTGNGPSGWGISGCTVRTDSHGTAYVFGLLSNNQAITGAPPPKGQTNPLPGQGAHVMWTSTDGGATWSKPQTLFAITDVCEFVDPLSQRCIMDGQTGARMDLGAIPSVDIANGAPTGAGATNLIVDAWSDATAGVNHERALVRASTDGGRNWSSPSSVSAPSDRPMYTAVAVSPNGDRAYVVYEAVTSAWAGSDISSPRPYHGVFMTAPASASGPGAWSAAYNGPLGDLRATFPGHVLWQERVGDYVYAAASRAYGIGTWIDTRNAAVCSPVQDWRGQSLAAGQPIIPAPWPLANCPTTFGNSDVWAATTG